MSGVKYSGTNFPSDISVPFETNSQSLFTERALLVYLVPVESKHCEHLLHLADKARAGIEGEDATGRTPVLIKAHEEMDNSPRSVSYRPVGSTKQCFLKKISLTSRRASKSMPLLAFLVLYKGITPFLRACPLA